MTEDTRDIAIRTATKVEEVEKKLDAALLTLDKMRGEMNERRGAERLARWIIGLGSGTVAGAISTFATKTFWFVAHTPMPK